jgi:hypothetical protein
MGRRLIIAAGVTALCLGGVLAVYAWAYPYGARPCSLPCVVSALKLYAADHEDRFPDGGKTPQEALRKLTPRYVNVSMLAGITGDRAEVQAAIGRGAELSDLQSSWVYFPGFKSTDDPNLAVIWERVGGVKFNGRRAEPGSHAVGFADGTHRQVRAADWEAFVQEQARLRESIQNGRGEQRPLGDEGGQPARASLLVGRQVTKRQGAATVW